MIRKLLVANRGEIARRIVRTARTLGIATVAIYTEADCTAPHASEADEAFLVPSYLDSTAIIAAARSAGAKAIHPGYGFLAENADFAEACAQNGFIFIGPSPGVIRGMGLKDAGRALAIRAGVPVVPEYEPGAFPVLIKAAAGGGGRGMRIVRDASEFDAAIESARREAEGAFGNGSLVRERYVENARHVEIQIFGDHCGNVIHLFERDCSVQRRYQKVIEESPSPALTPETREQMCDAAVILGHAMGYRNAGTVEFLLAPTGEFYFIEVNTRIQVEHPVTELVTGLDLIQLQIEVAEGRELKLGDVQPRGHAIEARLYSEDPANDFVPSTGRLHVWRPGSAARLDSGVEEGSEISHLYDPMLAKVIAFGDDRDTAIRKLSHALRSTAVAGVDTNRDYLVQVLEHPDFIGGRAHTAWRLGYQRDTGHDETLVEAAAAHIAAAHSRALAPYWRNNPFRDPVIRLELADRAYEQTPDRRQPHGVSVYPTPEGLYVHSLNGAALVRRVPRFPESAATSQHETANSPMPGSVLRILVTEGQQVKTGDALVVVEAMKMEQTIKTSIDGRVAAVLVKPGQVVAPGQMLIEIDATLTTGEKQHEHASRSAGGG